MSRRTTITPESGERMRARYLEGVPISRILAEFDVSLGTFYLWLDGGPKGGLNGAPPLTPLPRRRNILGQRRMALRASRRSLVTRLWRAIELQVRGIEKRVEQGEQTPQQQDRDNRTIAIIARVARDLPLLEEPAGAAEAKPGPDDDDDGGPHDIDEFRLDLARKIDSIVAARDSAVPGGPGPEES